MNATPDKPVVFFDGVCNLCNASVDLILRNDPKNRFLFSSLQGEAARRLLPPTDLQNLNTLIFYENGEIFRRSTAALKIAVRLSGLWPLFGVFFILPRFLRDPFYDLIARNRYRFWGKKETCRIPSPAERAKFLD